MYKLLRLVAAAAICLAVAAPVRAQTQTVDNWTTTGLLSAPVTAGTVLLEFPASDDANPIAFNFDFMVTASTTTVVLLQKIAADGTTVVRSQAIIANLGTQFDKDIHLILNPGEHVRLVQGVALTTGVMWASVLTK